MTRLHLLTGITLVTLLVSFGAFAGTAASAQVPTSTAGRDECDGAEDWLDRTWELNLQGAATLQRFAIEVQGGEPFDPEVFTDLADDLSILVRLHTASNPPPAGEELNELLIENRRLYAEAMDLFATYAAEDDEAAGDEPVSRTGRARDLGNRAFLAAADFKVACDLADNPAFQIAACFGQDAVMWLNLTSVRLTQFYDASDTAMDRLDVGLPIDDQLDEIASLHEEQEQSAVPEGAEAYQRVLLDYYETTREALRAWDDGDFEELERLGEELVALEVQIADEEQKFSAPCQAGGV